MLDSTYEKYKYLIGTQINKWTVLDIVEHRDKDKGYTYARCQCECGTIRDVRMSKLLNGTSKDCGCGQRERQKEAIINKYKYLIDTTINGWTILSIIPADSEHKHTTALCQCECGTIKEVRLSYVVNGRSKDCGCGRKKMLRETRTKNLVGQRFGKLVAIELLEDSDNFNRRQYKCRCDCGNETVVSSICLTSGHTISCGCINSRWNAYIKQFLDSNHIANKDEYPVVIDGTRYRYDFYLPDYNLFIEYDGEQHFMPIGFFGGEEEFKRRQEHDKIKNKYCEDNHINLLRIPYWEQNIETIINNHLQRLSEKGFAEAV